MYVAVGRELDLHAINHGSILLITYSGISGTVKNDT